MKSLCYLLALLMLPSAVWAQAGGKTEKFRVYIGTYSGKLSKGIYQCEIDLKDGKLSEPTVAAETTNPSFLAIHPSQKYLYAVGEGGGPGVNSFAVDAKTGKLTLINSQSSAGSGPCHLVVDHSGKVVLVANYGSGSCCSIPLGADGSLGALGSAIQHQGKSINKGNQEGPHAHSFNVDKANKFAFCADLGIDKVLVYRLDTAKGTLTANDPPAFVTPPGTGPRHFAFHPDGKTAFINGEISMTLIACDYDADKGVLTQKQIISTLPKDAERKGASTAEVVVHPSGKFVYVSNRGHNSIAIFALDEAGKLTAVGHQSENIKTPRNFAIEPTGQYLLVANQDGHSVISFRINAKTGELTPTGSRVEVGSPVCIRFMPTK